MEAGADASTADMHGAYPIHYAAQMCGGGSNGGVGNGATNGMGNGDAGVGTDARTGLSGEFCVVLYCTYVRYTCSVYVHTYTS